MKTLSFEQNHMSTRVNISVYDSDDSFAVKDSVRRAFDVFTDLEKRFSLFDKNSELNRINRFAGSKIKVSDIFLKTALNAQTMARNSLGIFNPLHRTGTHYSKLLIDEKNKTVLIPRGAVLDLNGIVKGRAIDEALACFPKNVPVIIEAGGDITVSEKPPLENFVWKIGIRNPFNHKKIITVLPIMSGAVCTSGLYFRGPHITAANPAIASLTVVAPSAQEADVLSTAAFSLPLGRIIEFIERYDDASCLIVNKSEDVFMSRRLREQFEKFYES